MYRIGLEEILGFRKRGNVLRIDPCIPPGWDRFEITYRHGTTTYQITVENPERVDRGVRVIELDGQALAPSDGIALDDVGRVRAVRVVMGL